MALIANLFRFKDRMATDANTARINLLSRLFLHAGTVTAEQRLVHVHAPLSHNHAIDQDFVSGTDCQDISQNDLAGVDAADFAFPDHGCLELRFFLDGAQSETGEFLLKEIRPDIGKHDAYRDECIQPPAHEPLHERQSHQIQIENSEDTLTYDK